jgi:hypothetical protein
VTFSPFLPQSQCDSPQRWLPSSHFG